jgi:hypothetical protein
MQIEKGQLRMRRTIQTTLPLIYAETAGFTLPIHTKALTATIYRRHSGKLTCKAPGHRCGRVLHY